MSELTGEPEEPPGQPAVPVPRKQALEHVRDARELTDGDPP